MKDYISISIAGSNERSATWDLKYRPDFQGGQQ